MQIHGSARRRWGGQKTPIYPSLCPIAGDIGMLWAAREVNIFHIYNEK